MVLFIQNLFANSVNYESVLKVNKFHRTKDVEFRMPFMHVKHIICGFEMNPWNFKEFTYAKQAFKKILAGYFASIASENKMNLGACNSCAFLYSP